MPQLHKNKMSYRISSIVLCSSDMSASSDNDDVARQLDFVGVAAAFTQRKHKIGAMYFYSSHYTQTVKRAPNSFKKRLACNETTSIC
jgi:hypothetical protein